MTTIIMKYMYLPNYWYTRGLNCRIPPVATEALPGASPWARTPPPSWQTRPRMPWKSVARRSRGAGVVAAAAVTAAGGDMVNQRGNIAGQPGNQQ